MTARREWTREELILAMNLYCQLPFGRLHKGTREIIALANAIERSPSSVAMKLSNLASLDPAHQERGVRGLTGASVADRSVWAEFHADWDALVVESEHLRTKYGLPLEPSEQFDETAMAFAGPTEAERTVKVRLAQRFFRHAVLTSFDGRCCVSGVTIPELLVASHIVPWSRSTANRTNPCNGLCLSRLHDGAFDKGLITLDEDLRLVNSKLLKDHFTNTVLRASFQEFEGRRITLPGRFRPDASFLQEHRTTIFVG